MNIYKQIETIFSGESEEKPQWVGEILNELMEIKLLLQQQQQKELAQCSPLQMHISSPQNQTKNDKKYYDFVKNFRASMRANTLNNIYPTFNYFGRKLGVDYSGLLYDKKDSKTLLKQEAFKVYRYAYEHQNEHEISA